ncbi:MAG: HAMP domain-containing histidine kinase [candidate division Zixibacteria bacterium]|nr:HAMP domain-containing histidine kinase [candidate division Zixibacteria bacterium]
MAGKKEKIKVYGAGRFSLYFKAFLLLGVCTIGAMFVYYTNDVIDDIQRSEARIAKTYTHIWQLVASDSIGSHVTSVLFDEVILKSTFPIVVTDTLENPLFWKALDGIPETSTDPEVLEKVQQKIHEMKSNKGEIPIYMDSIPIYILFYDDTALVDKLRWIPLVEMIMVVGFVFLALVGFQYIRLSDQRSIWVGMAKETAHQLGTPITSMMGWVDLLKVGDESFTKEEVYRRIDIDLNRLGIIANRFGKIGSEPILKTQDINPLTSEVAQYYRERLPHKGQGVQITFEAGDIPEINVNRELYNWVIENLLKNALEAVDSKTGMISVKTYRDSSGKEVLVKVSDNGKGIPRRIARRIFKPGYTTKKRGWGLGLSLSRRIIQDYHRGNISLSKSEPGAGATFVIRLPIA